MKKIEMQAARKYSRLVDTSALPGVDTFHAICSQPCSIETYPLASSIESRIPVYDVRRFDIEDSTAVDKLQDELYDVLLKGPGVYVLKNMYQDMELIDNVNRVFGRIIDKEKSLTKGDHFAAKGNNDRIWNSFGKHCLEDAASFVRYYSNPWLAMACESWLGPGYRITAQCNVVKPGGAAQTSHRDYHLGFQTAEACGRYPLSMQVASQLLTLQGAVAHSDMPLVSGPTRFLPYSQTFEWGYLAFREEAYQRYFLEHWVSLPLKKGDGVFFNPALFHAAGENRTAEVERSANLIQVSSAFGKPMESVATLPLVEKCWSALLAEQGRQREVERLAIIRAVAEGYPFPTNLDRRPPAPGGKAPEDEQQLLTRMLVERKDERSVVAALRELQRASQMV